MTATFCTHLFITRSIPYTQVVSQQLRALRTANIFSNKLHVHSQPSVNTYRIHSSIDPYTHTRVNGTPHAAAACISLPPAHASIWYVRYESLASNIIEGRKSPFSRCKLTSMASVNNSLRSNSTAHDQ